jgi:hypothetical protein
MSADAKPRWRAENAGGAIMLKKIDRRLINRGSEGEKRKFL